MSPSQQHNPPGSSTLTLGEILEEFDRRLGSEPEPEILTLTEKMGFVSQRKRFNKRLAIADTSDYKVVGLNDIAFNPYLLWAGAVAQNKHWKKAIISPLYPTFQVRDGYNPRFVDYLLCSGILRSHYDKISFGSVPRKRRTAVNDFLNLRIPQPPPPVEQDRIVRLLDEADGLRKLRFQADRRTADLVPALFHEMFGDPVENRMDYPIRRLGDVCHRVTDGTHQPPAFADEGIPFLFVRNIVSGLIDFDTEKFITDETFAELTRRVRPERGDVLYSTVGSYGVAVEVETDRQFAFQRHIGHLKPNHQEIDSSFLTAQLNTPWLRSQADQSARGIAQKTVNLAEIRRFKVLVPPVPLQKEFTRLSIGIRELESEQTAIRRRLEDLFQSLLHRAFRGEL